MELLASVNTCTCINIYTFICIYMYMYVYFFWLILGHLSSVPPLQRHYGCQVLCHYPSSRHWNHFDEGAIRTVREREREEYMCVCMRRYE